MLTDRSRSCVEPGRTARTRSTRSRCRVQLRPTKPSPTTMVSASRTYRGPRWPRTTWTRLVGGGQRPHVGARRGRGRSLRSRDRARGARRRSRHGRAAREGRPIGRASRHVRGCGRPRRPSTSPRAAAVSREGADHVVVLVDELLVDHRKHLANALDQRLHHLGGGVRLGVVSAGRISSSIAMRTPSRIWSMEGDEFMRGPPGTGAVERYRGAPARWTGRGRGGGVRGSHRRRDA